MTETAFAVMDASELRGLIRGIIPWLDEPTHARFANALVDRAARNAVGLDSQDADRASGERDRRPSPKHAPRSKE